MSNITPFRILVPVDFSEASARAVSVAATLASAVAGSVHLVHADVLDVPAYFTHEQERMLERERRSARDHAEAFLRDFGRAHGAQSFSVAILDGWPTDTIVETARSYDFVVMGTHGRRGPARWWMGSVAERVIHAAAVPALVVREDATRPADGAIFARPLLVGEANDHPGVKDLATRLTAAFGGRLSETSSCDASAATDAQASLIVLPKRNDQALLSHPAERWLRKCSLPMLFVPLG
jgi:nucleotide-binding universal stress UspA family protein